MMKNGKLKENNPKILALAYVSPVSMLIYYSDREPRKNEEALRLIEEFSNHFFDTYSI